MVQVALTLAEKVLSPPKQEVKVLSFDQVRTTATPSLLLFHHPSCQGTPPTDTLQTWRAVLCPHDLCAACCVEREGRKAILHL